MDGLDKRIADLSHDKRELLKQLLKRKKEGLPQKISAVQRDVNGFPLSYTQEWLWFLHELYKGGLTLNVCLVAKLNGNLNIEALELSLTEIIKRNEILRTCIVTEESGPVQRHIQPWTVKLDVAEWTNALADSMDAAVKKYVDEEYARPLSLSEGKLASFKLIRCGQDEHIIITVFHRLAFDEWSSELFLKELGNFYEAYAAGRQPELSGADIQYADFSVWQKKYIQSELCGHMVSYWKERLKDYKGLHIRTDNPRKDTPYFQEKRKALSVSETVANGIRQTAKSEGVPAAVILLSVFSVLLKKYSEQNDICIGLPVIVRNRLEIENLLGNFENLLILSSDISVDTSFQDVVRQNYSSSLEAHNNKEMPYLRLVTDVLDMDATKGFGSVKSIFHFQSMFPETVKAGDLSIIPVNFILGASGNDLTLFMREMGSEFSGELVYNGSLYSELTIEKMVGDYTSILREAVRYPHLSLSEIFSKIEVAEAETQVERSLVEIWKKVLECDQVGIHDNFFEIGGNSLLLVRMHELLEDKYPGRITIAKLFAYPTISRLAKYLEDGIETPGEKIRLTLLPLPEEYFAVDDSDDDSVLKFQLDNVFTDKLLTLSLDNHVEINDILISVYIYLLGEISGESDITVQTMTENSSRVFPLRVNLTGVEDLAEIIKDVSQKRREATEKDTYPLHLISAMDIEKENNSVGPMYISGCDPDDELLDAYDIKIKADIRSSSIGFICEYDSARLVKNKMEELVFSYKRLIEIISERVV